MHQTQIRPVRPEDEERIRHFLCGLSLHTKTLRFFSGYAQPAASLVRAMIALDERRDALVATTPDGEVVGHGMSYRGGLADVEVAVVVTDRWQGLGLGPRLINALVLRAAVRGARTVAADVMGENRRMLRLVRRMWPDARMTVSSGAVEVTAMIDQAVLFAEQGSGATPLTA
ncbi:GNAT family N-acetyltransferase [Actinomadura sp. ATCC 31491]|uniref:GNAT family N-acetyltransferase n=1 Tax=Actinomadura luzonensis TaxID=2805427 RepID=A0ABT0FP76_9ACTN|nr:GNAT family N-acetyltransferase [Actinomadura luzonensis]MCK2214149.1 GNAT family N-acetyltransferase [Actinomadura luzonensis]